MSSSDQTAVAIILEFPLPEEKDKIAEEYEKLEEKCNQVIRKIEERKKRKVK